MFIQAVTLEGKLRFKATFPKSQKAWRIKPIREPKEYSYLEDLVQRIIDTHLNPSQAVARRNLPVNIAKEERPPIEFLIEQHKSRFFKTT